MTVTEPELSNQGRYRIVSRIRLDRSGEVYKAVDEERGSFVAIKRLPEVSPDDRKELRRQFLQLRAIRHPNLVELRDFVERRNECLVSMEFVEGIDLIGYTRPRDQGTSPGTSPLGTNAGQLDEVRLRSALNQVAQAVATLHAAGRAHHDLEPSNIRVNPQGRVVVMGMRLGNQGTNGQNLDASALAAGPYMAPEWLRGGKPELAADWYSVGALLFESLTGSPPPPARVRDRTGDPEVPGAEDLPPDLVSLCHKLLNTAPHLRPGGAEVMAALQLTAESQTATAQSLSLLGEAAPFVGRKRELDLLTEAFERTRHGSVSCICLFGDSGVGKRRIASQLARKLRHDHPHLVHLQGSCFREGPAGYRGMDGVVDSLSRYLATQDATVIGTLLPHDAPVLRKIFPTMGRVPMPDSSVATSTPAEPPELRRKAFRALRDLMNALALRHPLLMVIDDIQWADKDSLALLDELVNSPQAPTMLVVLLVNGELGDANEPLRQWLTRQEDRVAHMRIRELRSAAVAELAGRLLEPAGKIRQGTPKALAARSQGHPLTLDTLVRHYLLNGEFPGEHDSLELVLWRRVQMLSEPARDVLACLCVARVPLPLDVAADAAQISPESFARHVATMRVANLIRMVRDSHGERLTPAHEAIRRAVLPQLDERRAEQLHRQLALAMVTWQAAPAETIATHWMDARSPDRGATHLAIAADRAAETLAFEAAADLYSRALAMAPRGTHEHRRLRIQLADALAHSGYGTLAARSYLLAARGADEAEGLELQRRAAHQLLRGGHIGEGLRTVEKVLERMGERLPLTPRRALFSLAVRRARLTMRGLSFRERDSTQIPPSDLLRADTLGSLAAALDMVDNVRGADFHTRYLLLALDLGDPVRIARAVALEASYLASNGSSGPEQWREMMTRAKELAERTGDARARGLALTVHSTATFLTGNWRENIEASTEAERVLTTECTDVDWEIGNARVSRAVANLYIGELKEMQASVTEQVREASERGDHYTHTNLRVAAGYLLHLIANEPERAAAVLDDAIARWDYTGYQMQHFFHLLGSAQVELYQGSGDPYARVMQHWPLLSRAYMLRIDMVAHTIRHLRGRAALWMASRGTENSQFLLRDAESCGRSLINQRGSFAVGWGYALCAGLAAYHGDTRNARSLLRNAEADFYEKDMGLYAAAARLQLGYLAPDDAGRSLAKRAEDWFLAQGIRRPARFASMLLPGFAAQTQQTTG